MSPYTKWKGSHWVLAALADLGYPTGDSRLRPLVDQVLDQWLDPAYRSMVPGEDSTGIRRTAAGIPVIRGRARAHASMHGNALRALAHLGLGGRRREALAELLLEWQWPDGGWNCDRTATANTSSFMETLLPMRGLAAHARCVGEDRYRTAAERAAEVFLARQMFRRRSDGTTIRPDFLRLHYPLYWHYDVLGGLVGIAEVGRLGDRRTRVALDWLQDRELTTGGWPAEARYYRVTGSNRTGAESVEWGAVNPRQRNDWVTVDALTVLCRSGRISV